jgi:hypothetical protein
MADQTSNHILIENGATVVFRDIEVSRRTGKPERTSYFSERRISPILSSDYRVLSEDEKAEFLSGASGVKWIDLFREAKSILLCKSDKFKDFFVSGDEVRSLNPAQVKRFLAEEQEFDRRSEPYRGELKTDRNHSAPGSYRKLPIDFSYGPEEQEYDYEEDLQDARTQTVDAEMGMARKLMSLRQTLDMEEYRQRKLPAGPRLEKSKRIVQSLKSSIHFLSQKIERIRSRIENSNWYDRSKNDGGI